MGNYILTNLKAIGFIIEGVSGGKISFVYAIIILSLIFRANPKSVTIKVSLLDINIFCGFGSVVKYRF